ncbi:aminodeoxychorismate lyase [Neosynechococcus sphagnicola sy1]|uniref:Endolytic murein transglycosylase n=2 Tax=Neosynechococcus TaxID=1501143 RepID=A0A098TFY3_9CYAN|nr:aminodeoxychorismate lyase [Neosynechococcus sphagnicola sy1]
MAIQRLSQRWLYLTVPLATCSFVGCLGWFWWSWVTAPVNASAIAQTIQIAPGTPAQQIGQDLETLGVIRSTTAWELWARWLSLREPQGSFQAGTYELSPRLSLEQVATKIWLGEVVQQPLTIPEGWSLRQMAAEFERQGFFSAEAFMAAAHKIPYAQYPWLPQELPHLEGFLYPDTYLLPKDQITPQQVVHLMLSRFEQVALPLYQRQQSQTPLSLRAWVTLASIVEKEAVIPEERPRIAGVFLRRLQLGMTLGSDPTVEYGLGIQQTPDQPLTLRQVNTASPYNTYLNPGLPPTPIASPGRASLQAVLTPEVTPYLYFVARYDGSHVFSRTLAAHEAAQAAIQARRGSQPHRP